jgi:predicted DNA-binding ribbon-helix-helix protein
MTHSRLVNRNVFASRGRTSIRLEPEFWTALEEICRREGKTLHEVVTHMEQNGWPGKRTSTVRVQILLYFHEAATEDGHKAAGHGTVPFSAGAAAPTHS